jgi:adenine-specific DNA-methyltransferase
MNKPKTSRNPASKRIETLTHDKAARKNIPTAEYQSVAERMEEQDPVEPVRFPRATPLAEGEARERNEDLDPQIIWRGARIRLSKEQARQLLDTGEVEIGEAQLVWRGKDRQDWSDLIAQAPPLYIQEKVHPKAIIDALKRQTKEKDDAPDLFADFNGLPDPEARTEFYQHNQHWANRFILGDSLSVMASLAEREGLRGNVQCIYFDPPYGIKFNSNWQVSTQSRDVKDGKQSDITREPEVVKAFRDTWKEGIHSYLTYLRDRLTVARELLTESGSIFVQIGDENVHRVRAVMDEVFGAGNCICEILVKKKGSQKGSYIDPVNDYILWYGRSPRDSGKLKSRPLFESRTLDHETIDEFSRIELPDGTIENLKTFSTSDGEFIDFRSHPKRIQELFPGGRILRPWPITNGGFRENQMAPIMLNGKSFSPPTSRCWSHTSKGLGQTLTGMERVRIANRLMPSKASLDFKRYLDDFPFRTISNWWDGFGGASDQVYIVQTNERIAQRCILMTTDPGDLVLDPTCGSGTTAYVAEQWGRRWITIDTSRVALALARTRLMSARYPYYLLADTPEGRRKQQEVSGKLLAETATHGDIRLGFVYRQAHYITSGQIANNAEIDVIYDKWQAILEPLRAQLNKALGRVAPSSFETPASQAPQDKGASARARKAAGAAVSPHPEAARSAVAKGEAEPAWEEWQIPRESGDLWETEAIKAHSVATDPRRSEGERKEALARLNKLTGQTFTLGALPQKPRTSWPAAAAEAHAKLWEGRIARQKEIDAAIARAADVELLYDRPYEDKSRVRVAGPFTVESLSPHRVAPADEEELIDLIDADEGARRRLHAAMPRTDFAEVVLENLRSAGVHQSEKRDRISFVTLTPWPGEYIGADGRFMEGESERRAAIFIGPEFGTLSRVDLAAAAREAVEARFDVLIACAFSFDAHASEMTKLGPMPILKAKMNPDLHMAGDLKNTGKGNLFVVFGEPDIDLAHEPDGRLKVRVKGVDVFDPNTGDIRSSDTKGIAAWFIDTDYNEESFYVRHAYFLGANDPYKSLKTALQAEIDKDAWETLYRDVSRPFDRPKTGKIAVKVINHFGDEVMKVFKV